MKTVGGERNVGQAKAPSLKKKKKQRTPSYWCEMSGTE